MYIRRPEDRSNMTLASFVLDSSRSGGGGGGGGKISDNVTLGDAFGGSSTLPSSVSNTARSDDSEWSVGDSCKALYEDDGEWYNGKILEIDRTHLHVDYVGYDDSAWLSVYEVKPRKKIGKLFFAPKHSFSTSSPSTTNTTAVATTSTTTTTSAKATPAVPPGFEVSVAKSKSAISGGGSSSTRSSRENDISRIYPLPATPPKILSAGARSAEARVKRAGSAKKNGASTPTRSTKSPKTKRADLRSTPQLKRVVSAPSRTPDPPRPPVVRRREGIKKRLTMVVIGHVDAGKSTLMGHLLYDLKYVDRRSMRKFEKESRECGKPSFKYAWVLDENEEERSRGVTMEVGCSHFETSDRVVTLLDAPGHRDFIPSMITGAAQADVAVLVIPASRGEFEAGFSSDGQTKEHASLALNLGIHQLLVAVNKLDMVQWDQDRFCQIEKRARAFLEKIGWKSSSISFVPVSGLDGTNVVKPPAESCPLLKWYDGPTLVEQINTFVSRTRLDKKPFRLCLADVLATSGSKTSATISGKIEAGSVARGDRLLVMPLGSVCRVKSIVLRGTGAVDFGAAGENVDLHLVEVDPQLLEVGHVLCSVSRPISVARKFKAKIRTLQRLENAIMAGQCLTMHAQCVDVPVNVSKLLRTIDEKSGKTLKKRPRRLVKGTLALVEITLKKPLCMEAYADYPQLGRFVLRDGGKTVCAGAVEKIRE
eukprot:g364.t1